MNTDYKNVNDYIASQPIALQTMLEQIRSVIRSVIPTAEEVISYHVPSYKHHGMLVGFGVHKNGCSFYAMNAKILGAYARELTNYTYATSTIHFNPQKKLPVALIKKITRQRIKENEERAFIKKQSKIK